MLEIEGARLDVYPSGMSSEVGMAHVLRPGRHATLDDLVEPLAPLSGGRVARPRNLSFARYIAASTASSSATTSPLRRTAAR